MKLQITNFSIKIPQSVPDTDMQVTTDSISMIFSSHCVHGFRHHRRHWRQ